jgi:hypothetical protein
MATIAAQGLVDRDSGAAAAVAGEGNDADFGAEQTGQDVLER